MISSLQLRRYEPPSDEWDAWNESEAEAFKPRVVPEEDREAYKRATSLRMFYWDCRQTLDVEKKPVASRWQEIGRKKIRSQHTIDKELNALTRWERFTVPASWPDPSTWPGPSLKFLEGCSSDWLDRVWDRMLASGLAPATVKSTRSHLNVIFRHAVRVHAMARSPESTPVEKGDERTKIYTPDQVDLALRTLRSDILFYGAFWVALHAGPRSVDLFTLRKSSLVKDSLGRRMLDFQSRKTKKLQAVPISKETAEVINELIAAYPDSDYLFPGLTDPESDDPEHSYASRIRNAMMKQFLLRAGIKDMKKPWQSARATCNERYEAHRPGVGPFILGHSLQGVNAQSYRQPTEAVHEAVRTLPPYSHMSRQRRLF